jgi:hypothetical protein
METAGTLPPQPAAPRVERAWTRFDAPNVLWFFGFYAITFASLAVINKIPEAHHDLWEFLVSLAFFAAFAILGTLLAVTAWHIPSGLAVAMAVAMVPAVGFGFTSLVRAYPKNAFADPFQDFSGAVFGIGVATALVALVAYAMTRFPFLLFEFTLAVAFTAQFFLPGVDDQPSADAHAVTALLVGVALVVIGLLLDSGGRRRTAFWFHVIGFLNVAIALTYYAADYSGDVNRGWIPMLIVGALVLLLSAPLWRATWALYGVLGFYAPIFHWLTNGVNPDSLGYAFILLAIGTSIFLVGFALSRFGALWLERRRSAPVTTPPPAPPPPAV